MCLVHTVKMAVIYLFNSRPKDLFLTLNVTNTLFCVTFFTNLQVPNGLSFFSFAFQKEFQNECHGEEGILFLNEQLLTDQCLHAHPHTPILPIPAPHMQNYIIRHMSCIYPTSGQKVDIKVIYSEYDIAIIQGQIADGIPVASLK